MKNRITNLENFINENNGIYESRDFEPGEVEQIQAALPALEKLIQKRCGMKVKLNAELNTSRREDASITSGSLMKDYGDNPVVKVCFSDINIYFWVGKSDNENEVYFIPKVSYQHPGGGSNSTSFIWNKLMFDLDTNTWNEGRLLIK